MHQYRIHTLTSAPEKSRPALEALERGVGRIPNLAATMAESPVLIGGFVGAFANFHGGGFSGAEKQILLLTNAVTNRCTWAVAFHSTLALKEGVSSDDVDAVRGGALPRDPRLAALSRFTRALIERRGHVAEEELETFARAGFEPDRVLEVIAGLAVSVMANYAGNITQPQLEEPFRPQAWRAPA